MHAWRKRNGFKRLPGILLPSAETSEGSGFGKLSLDASDNSIKISSNSASESSRFFAVIRLRLDTSLLTRTSSLLSLLLSLKYSADISSSWEAMLKMMCHSQATFSFYKSSHRNKIESHKPDPKPTRAKGRMVSLFYCLRKFKTWMKAIMGYERRPNKISKTNWTHLRSTNKEAK